MSAEQRRTRLQGERGFGFTIVGGDEPGEMIQINAIVATGNNRRSGTVKHKKSGVNGGLGLLRLQCFFSSLFFIF